MTAHKPSRSSQYVMFMDSCVVLALLALCSSSIPVYASCQAIGQQGGADGRTHGRIEGPKYEMKFEPSQPEPMFKSDGGCILMWDCPMMTHMGLMDARKITINKESLLLPQYANSHRLLVMIKGCAHMGFMLPLGMKANIRKVSKGEIVAVPKGMPMWMYNEGPEPCTFLTFANIYGPMVHGCNKYQAFHLSGAMTEDEMGGILHGFSEDMLMQAMDVDERTVRELKKNQDGVAIVKMSSGPKHDELKRQIERDYGRGQADAGGGGLMVDFGYHLDKAHRDIVSPQAGQLTIVNGYKLPVLKLMDMSVGCLKLDNKALTAPGWFTNADAMIYCVHGSARVQVVLPSGKMACDIEMNEGDMMMVPKNYPMMMQAGEDGFDAATIMNSHRPVSMHMTGKDSVFNMMPPEVRMGTFEISREMDKRVHEESRHLHRTFLLPPQEHRRRDNGCLEGEDCSTSTDADAEREAIWSMFKDSRDLVQKV